MPALPPHTDTLLEELDGCCSAGYAATFRLRFNRPLLFRTTHDAQWSHHYGENNFALCDPAMVWAIMHTGFIRWSEMKTPDPFGVLDKASEFGLKYGATISYGCAKARSVMVGARPDREFPRTELEYMQSIFISIHDGLQEHVPLTHEQTEALRLFSLGHNYNEIMHHLNISRTAVTSRLNGARKRLNARTNVDAVRIATKRSVLDPHPFLGSLGRK